MLPMQFKNAILNTYYHRTDTIGKKKNQCVLLGRRLEYLHKCLFYVLFLGAAVAAAAANGHSKKKKAAGSDDEDDPFVVSDSDSEGILHSSV